MTPSGRRPRPLREKVARGERSSRVNDAPLRLREHTPAAPDWLAGVAREEYDRVAGVLEEAHALADVDRAALTMYALAWADLVAARSVMAEQGTTQVTRTGYSAPRPEVAIADRAERRIREYAALLGLSPADRERLIDPRGPAPDDDGEDFELLAILDP